jgi:hypothetical protein
VRRLALARPPGTLGAVEGNCQRSALQLVDDDSVTDILASLLHKGVLSLDLVAQDGMRVRA